MAHRNERAVPNAQRAHWSLVTGLAIFSALLTGCGGREPEHLGQSSAELDSDTLGFETAAAWSTSSGTLSTSSVHVEGSHSVAVQNSGWTDVVSVPVSSLGTVGTNVRFKIQLPQPVPWGETRVILVMPSHQIWWSELGSVQLTGLSAGTFQTIQLPLTSALVTALSGTYSDLVIHVVINAPTFAGQPYLLDQLDFGQAPSGSGGSTGSGGATGTGGGATGGSATGGTTGSSGGTAATGGATASGGSGGTAATGGSGGIAQVLSVDFERPPLLALSDIAALASQDANLGDRAVVHGPAGTLPATVAMGGAGMVLGADSNVGDVYARNTLTLRDRAHIAGSVFTTQPVQGLGTASVSGSVITDFQFDPTVHTHWTANEPATNHGDLMLEPENHQTLEPGRWGHVSVKSRASITLASGEYFFDSLDVLEPQAELRVDETNGPVKLYLLDHFVYRGAIVRVDEAGPADLLVVMLGQQIVFLEAPFQGFLVAPNATVDLRQTTPAHSGAIFAESLVFDAGATVEHRPFVFQNFFPATLALPVLSDQPVGIIAPGDPDPSASTNLDLPKGQRDCLPGLQLGSEVQNQIQPVSSLTYRESNAQQCVVPYTECQQDGAGVETIVGPPNLSDLNRVPAADEICRGQPDIVAPCGVDTNTIVWDDVFGPCANQADCLPFGKVCAKVCLKAACTGSADCVEVSCEHEIQYRCATPQLNCEALPTVSLCDDRRECAEADATGSSDPEESHMTDRTSNVTDPPATTPADPPAADQPPIPAHYADETTRCHNPEPSTVNVDLEPEADNRDAVSGNDKWGVFAHPTIQFQARAIPDPLAGDAGFKLDGKAALTAGVRVWDETDLTVVDAGAEAHFERCKASLSRTLKLFGFDVVPGSGNDRPLDNEDLCDGLVNADDPSATIATVRPSQVGFLKELMFAAMGSKRHADALGPPDSTNSADWQNLCDASLGLMTDEAGALGHLGFDPLPLTKCDTGDDWRKVPGAWIDVYRRARDALAEQISGIAAIKGQIRSELPPSPLELINETREFTAFEIDFVYPIGPVSVEVEIDLVGRYGLFGDLTYQYELNPGAIIQAGARVGPELGATAIAFAGIGIGPVTVGLSGELDLVTIRLPLIADVTLEQIAQNDPRTPILSGASYAFPSFGRTAYKWQSHWEYGAGLEGSFLDGDVNLEARIHLLFYKKRFKKQLAHWNGIHKSYSFIGNLDTDPANGDVGINGKTSNPEFGFSSEESDFPDPDYLANTNLCPSGGCAPPDLSLCEIIH